jgi:hypothetical protein
MNGVPSGAQPGQQVRLVNKVPPVLRVPLVQPGQRARLVQLVQPDPTGLMGAASSQVPAVPLECAPRGTSTSPSAMRNSGPARAARGLTMGRTSRV